MKRTLPVALLLESLILTGCAVPGDHDSGRHDPARSEPETMPPTRLIVAFGDSYTEGFGASEEQAYPALLSRALDRTILNKGVSGQTAAEALRRLDRDVIRNNPDVVIVEFGVNEAYRGYPVERALEGIDQIAARVASDTDARLVIVGVHFWAYQEDFDKGIRAIADRYHAGLVTDVLDGIVSSRRDTDDGDPKLRHDPFHPNAAGYAIIADRIRPALEAAIEARGNP